MGKNYIRFIATETGINCEGNVTLSALDKEKAEKNLKKVQQAAKDCGASLSLSPVGIQLGFNVALSCDTKCINEANARMKCIIEQLKDFIHNLNEEVEQNNEDLEDNPDKLIAEHQHKLVSDFFYTIHKQYPNAKIVAICDNGDWASVTGNMDPMHAFACLMGAVMSEEHGKNQ